jgi:hypothetical protein
MHTLSKKILLLCISCLLAVGLAAQSPEEVSPLEDFFKELNLTTGADAGLATMSVQADILSGTTSFRVPVNTKISFTPLWNYSPHVSLTYRDIEMNVKLTTNLFLRPLYQLERQDGSVVNQFEAGFTQWRVRLQWLPFQWGGIGAEYLNWRIGTEFKPSSINDILPVGAPRQSENRLDSRVLFQLSSQVSFWSIYVPLRYQTKKITYQSAVGVSLIGSGTDNIQTQYVNFQDAADPFRNQSSPPPAEYNLSGIRRWSWFGEVSGVYALSSVFAVNISGMYRAIYGEEKISATMLGIAVGASVTF